MNPIVLFRIDPTVNMARFYRVEIAPTLFGEISVLRNWGRIGTQGRMNVETCATPEEADRTAAQTLRQKARRGYRDLAPGTDGHSFGIFCEGPAS